MVSATYLTLLWWWTVQSLSLPQPGIAVDSSENLLKALLNRDSIIQVVSPQENDLYIVIDHVAYIVPLSNVDSAGGRLVLSSVRMIGDVVDVPWLSKWKETIKTEKPLENAFLFYSSSGKQYATLMTSRTHYLVRSDFQKPLRVAMKNSLGVLSNGLGDGNNYAVWCPTSFNKEIVDESTSPNLKLKFPLQRPYEIYDDNLQIWRVDTANVLARISSDYKKITFYKSHENGNPDAIPEQIQFAQKTFGFIHKDYIHVWHIDPNDSRVKDKGRWVYIFKDPGKDPKYSALLSPQFEDKTLELELKPVYFSQYFALNEQVSSTPEADKSPQLMIGIIVGAIAIALVVCVSLALLVGKVNAYKKGKKVHKRPLGWHAGVGKFAAKTPRSSVPQSPTKSASSSRSKPPLSRCEIIAGSKLLGQPSMTTTLSRSGWSNSPADPRQQSKSRSPDTTSVRSKKTVASKGMVVVAGGKMANIHSPTKGNRGQPSVFSVDGSSMTAVVTQDTIYASKPSSKPSTISKETVRGSSVSGTSNKTSLATQATNSSSKKTKNI